MQIIYAPRALDDLAAIEAYIMQYNPAAARRVLAVIKSAIDDLELFPRLGLPIDNQGRYRLPVGRLPYVVFYRTRHEPDFYPAYPARRTPADRPTRFVNNAEEVSRLHACSPSLGHQNTDSLGGQTPDTPALRVSVILVQHRPVSGSRTS